MPWIERADAVRNLERQVGQDWPQRYQRVFQRAHAHRILPAKFSHVWRKDDVVPRHSVENLHVVQVEVNGVSIHAVVRDLPDLRAVVGRGDRSDLDARGLQRQVGGVDHFGCRVDIRIKDHVLRASVRRNGFHAEVGGHAAVLVES